MPLPMADFGFDLSNREIATLIYLSLLLASVLLWKEVRPLAFNVVRAFFMPQLALLWLLMSFYVAVCVLLLAEVNLWEWPNLKSTLLWWVTIGFTSVFEAQQLKDKPHALRKLVRDAFTLSAIIFFLKRFFRCHEQ